MDRMQKKKDRDHGGRVAGRRAKISDMMVGREKDKDCKGKKKGRL